MAEAFVQMTDQIDEIDPFKDNMDEALWTKLLAVNENPKESKKMANEMILTRWMNPTNLPRGLGILKS